MSFARLYLLLNYGASASYTFFEILNAFWLGARLDASIVAYLFSVAILLVFLIWLLHLKFLQKYLYGFFKLYFVLFLTLLSGLTFADLSYFSFFGEHSTLMIFGVVDDDTKALLNIAFENYNVPVIATLSLIYLGFLYFVVFKIIKENNRFNVSWNLLKQGLFFLIVIAVVALLGRGSVGLFPLAKDVPDVSSDPFINKLPQTSGYALLNSYEQYMISKSGNYDLIKMAGYSGKIEKAFEIHTQKKKINKEDLLSNIRYTTPHNEVLQKRKPNVVLDVVESFGAPILDYQSDSFDIMRSLKKHFDEDIVFKNFISSSNGTIVSLEPLLLNTTARPLSTPFGQSKYLNTSFSCASAKVYQDAGYETTFVYGGDLSWRNVGSFFSRQGFDHVYGKAAIVSKLGLEGKNVFHDWGVYDKYLHQFVLTLLKEAKKPQLIVVMTTNNHPPYVISPEYTTKNLIFSDELKKHLTTDLPYAHTRFQDYQYALDMVGNFLDEVKKSSLKDNTVVAVTADNNTVEGIMKYDDYYTQTKRIPFYLYLPSYLKPKKAIDMRVAGSHKDIFPTLYNLTLSDISYTAIGTNLLDSNQMHCGFNDAGVIMTRNGGFKEGKALTDEQKECQKYYKASLAVTEYLVKSQKK